MVSEWYLTFNGILTIKYQILQFSILVHFPSPFEILGPLLRQNPKTQISFLHHKLKIDGVTERSSKLGQISEFNLHLSYM